MQAVNCPGCLCWPLVSCGIFQSLPSFWCHHAWCYKVYNNVGDYPWMNHPHMSTPMNSKCMELSQWISLQGWFMLELSLHQALAGYEQPSRTYEQLVAGFRTRLRQSPSPSIHHRSTSNGMAIVPLRHLQHLVTRPGLRGCGLIIQLSSNGFKASIWIHLSTNTSLSLRRFAALLQTRHAEAQTNSIAMLFITSWNCCVPSGGSDST